MICQSTTDAVISRRTERFSEDSSEVSEAVATIEQSLAAISLKHEIEGLAILLGLFRELNQMCKRTGHPEILETKGRAGAWNSLNAAYVKRIIVVLRSIELNYHAHELLVASTFFKEHLKYDNGNRSSHMDMASSIVQPSHTCDKDWRTKVCDYNEELSMAIPQVLDGVDQAARDRSVSIKGTIAKAVEGAEQRRLNPGRRYW